MLKLELVRRELSRVYNKSDSTVERFNILHDVEELVKELRQSTIDNLDTFETRNTDISSTTYKEDEDTLKRIIEVVAWQSGSSQNSISEFINNNTSVHDAYDHFGFDSLDMVEIVMALEEEFGVEISDDDAERCQTVQCLINLVTKKD